MIGDARSIRTHYWTDGVRGYAVYVATLERLLGVGVLEEFMLRGAADSMLTAGRDDFGHPYRIKYLRGGRWRVIRTFYNEPPAAESHRMAGYVERLTARYSRGTS
jgi:hypothetical protein